MTKEIKLTRGKIALVDDDMFEDLNQYNWYAKKGRNTFYASRGICIDNGKRTCLDMHRTILGLEPGDGKIADHRNMIGTDNRRSNLRIVSHKNNIRNAENYINNASGHTGVYWQTQHKKWRARIMANYKDIHLGYYDEIEGAVEARRQGEIKYWGEEQKHNKRRENLSISSPTINSHNRRKGTNNSSGYTGVGYVPDHNKWRARITVNYKEIHLGHFDKIDDAIKARRQAEQKYWGKDAL